MTEAFFKYSENPFCLFDGNLNYVEVNLAYENIFGLKGESLIGKNISEVLPGVTYAGRYEQYSEVLFTGKPITLDLDFDFPDRGTLSARLFVFKAGEGLGISMTPITDLIETIADLDTFLYKAVHDIRSPLASVIGLLNISENEEDIAMLREYLKLMRQQTEKMDNSLKAFTGTLRTEPIDFSALVNELMISLAFLEGFREVDVQIKIEVKRTYIGNKALVTSVLQNLVENAIKYRRVAQERPEVRIDIVQEEDLVHMKISDNGQGIAEQDQKNIFKLFFRANSGGKGQGVGLFTVITSVKKLGGEINFKSAEGKGTVFNIYLPYKGK